jgi:rod shape-determining protein MreC
MSAAVSRRAREVLICAVLLSAPLAWLRYAARSPSGLNPFDRALLRASAPLQAAVSAGVGGVRHLLRNYVALVDLRQENLKLSRELDGVRAENAQLRRAAEERARLEGLLRFQRETPAETVAARVIGRETSPFFRVTKIQLNRGQGLVRPGMPVLTSAGLVGRIHRVYGKNSDVLLAADAQSRIDVVLDRTRARGVIRGLGSPSHYRCHFEYLSRSDEVAVGDLVITSGIGGKFPRDLVVGKVSKVVRKDFGVFQEAEIEPSVDFSRLEEVLVMVAPPLAQGAAPSADPAGEPGLAGAVPPATGSAETVPAARGSRRKGSRAVREGERAAQGVVDGRMRAPLP